LRVFIHSFGCSANTADSEVLAGCLKQAGYQLANSQTESDILIFNSCAVKGPTENRIINAIKQAPKRKKIIVAGCLPMVSFERLLHEVQFDAAVGPSVGKKIVEIVNRVVAGERVVELADLDTLPKLDLPKVKSSPVISIVPINYGCLGSCAYCCVVQARGHLRSYSIKEVTDRIQADVVSGFKEFWVTSQDTACYGREIRSNIAELLLALRNVAGDFRVRIGMMTPNMVIDIQQSLISAFSTAKVFKFLHLPIQSGDDQTLNRMRRFYTVAEFKSILEAFREEFPDLTLATDVILGFPGETEEAFQNTLKLLKEVKPDVTNVSKFFARPKTAAAKMKDSLVEKEEIKRRSTLTAELVKRISLERNLRWVGWEGDVLVDEKGKVEGSWMGRNFAYKPVVLKSPENLLGKTLQVEVVEASPTYLKGTITERKQ
jgi:threonylcarbamoyladenosine tRNA methylthiotransferase CDKAL1